MATIYTQTLHLNLWKEHICFACGCRYRPLFMPSKKRAGASPDKAAANAEKAVVKALSHEVDHQPCPGCGLYQPDMVAARRVPWHWIISASGFGVAVLLWILTGTDVLSLGVSALTAAVV